MNFADRIHRSIAEKKSCIVAGIDPVLDAIPALFIDSGITLRGAGGELLTRAIVEFYRLGLEAIAPSIAAVKPNLAFFEQYGVAGIHAFEELCAAARSLGLPIIADAKRGDIGTTAQAYSTAYLGKTAVGETTAGVFDVDALTVSPFLGRDTIEPFLKDCEAYGKGIYVLVKTSNPGSGWIQGSSAPGVNATISREIAAYLAEHAGRLMGSSGYSGLGAVVGATYPHELTELRAAMPKNLLLVPGMGAQGGSARDVAPAIDPDGQGALINLSRGIFGQIDEELKTRQLVVEEISQRVARFNAELRAVH